MRDLPDGYDTVVGERGLTLSGGQRQRISIARALLTDPRVLVLDDATSSVDARTEEQIHATLREVMTDRTTVLIAHRRSTLELADRIVLVDDGAVADSGTHAELLARSAAYRALLGGGDDAEGDRRSRRPRRRGRGRRSTTSPARPPRRCGSAARADGERTRAFVAPAAPAVMRIGLRAAAGAAAAARSGAASG